MDIHQRCSILELASPFSLLSRPEQERLAARMTECFLRTGDTLFERGDPGDAFYVVASGRARVIGQDASGREISLSVLKRGDHFGDIALLTEVPRTATVRAAEDLVLLRLDRHDFLNYLGEHPHVRVALERFLKDFSTRDFLRQFTAMSAVPAALLRQVMEQLQEHTIPSGTIVVREGEPADAFYIVREGMLQAVKRDNGTEHIVNAIGPGRVLRGTGPDERHRAISDRHRSVGDQIVCALSRRIRKDHRRRAGVSQLASNMSPHPIRAAMS